MKNLLLLILLVLTANSAMAGFVQEQDVGRVYVGSDGFAYFGTSTQPPNSCYYFGEYFRFDVKNDTGKAKLTVLLSAKMAQKKIVVWYSDSAAIGTTNANGCSPGVMSIATDIGVN